MTEIGGTGARRIDELFGLPASEFVAAREALARELRAAGRKDAAAEVHALRRPTVVAWSINQIARTHADQLADLVAAGTAVQEAQRLAADGVDTDLRAASRRRRALLDQLTEAAAALTDNPSGQRAAIEATLDGASLDPDLEPALVAGRLTKELPPTARFAFGDASIAATPTTREARTAPARRRTPKPARDDLAVRRARQALEQARTRAEAAATDGRDATEAVDDAQQEVEAATRRVADLQAAVEAARVEVLEAKRRVTEARRAETSAKSAERRALASLRHAEGAVDDAEAGDQ
jgi:hypothetical protein